MNEKNEVSCIRVLIISDRLYDRAIELADALNAANIKVVALVKTKEEAINLSDQNIDFLIIAGFLKYEQSYDFIEEFRYRNSSIVFWAILDELIYYYCITYKITLYFNRLLPKNEFIEYLQNCHSVKKNKEELKASENIEVLYENNEIPKKSWFIKFLNYFHIID